MNTPAHFERVAVLGAGVIGASWAALFKAAGLRVEVYDADPDAEGKVRRYVDRAMPALHELGMANQADAGSLHFHADAATAVRETQFVQESVPERIELKHGLYAEIEPQLHADAVVASSASGLLVKEMQQGWRDPGRFVLGHPFNPPHLIPLVEILGNEHTADGVVALAEAFYAQVGKVTIRVRREVPAHVANRLQAALWREAIHLVETGVASVEDVDKAVWAGPGLRWAAMGPHQLFNLAAGPGGMEEFCERYGESFRRWWDDLGAPELTPELRARLAAGVTEEAGGEDLDALGARRDALIVSMIKATRPLRDRQ